jgi:predicted TPR repeat methyltransferase
MMLNNGRARPTPAGVLLSVAIAPLSFVALVLFFVWRRPRTTTPAEVWVMAAASAKTGVPTKEFIRYYDRESKRYDKLTEQVGWKVPAWVEGKVEFFNAGDSILDLGCADGLIGSVLQNLQGDMQFTGLDLSKQMVKKCLRNGYQAAFAADLSKGLPHHFLNGKMYDVVTAFGCLEFIKDHEGLMQDITKYLKPGGHFLASFEVERPELDNDILVMGVRKNIRTPETVRHMLEEAGFDVLHADLEECAYLWVDEIDDQRVPIPYLMVAARRQEE